jgi:hypothetical protein
MRSREAIISVAVLGISFGCATAATSGVPGTSATVSSEKVKSNPDLITTAEIDAGTYRDAYDIVQRLRPNWFTKAKATSTGSLGGMQVSGGSSGMTAVQGSSSSGGLVVYLDNHRLGGPEALRDLTPATIKSLQYMDAATATAKLSGLGSTVVTGAIVATSRTGS